MLGLPGWLDSELLGADWSIPGHAPLLTRWAREVSPTNALPEYPRPQMVRERWQNLNGLWDYAITARTDERRPDAWTGKILVPYPIESALSGVMKPLKPDQRLWYRRTFSLPKDWVGQRVLLHFGAVDWQATLFVNGRELGGHRGGYDAFTFDLTRLVKADAPNELVLSVWDPTDTTWHLHGKQTLKPAGCSYTASSGIWQTVWLEPVPPTTRVETLRAVPDLEAGVLRLTLTGRVGHEPVEIEARAFDGGREVAVAGGQAGLELWPALRENKVDFYKNTGSWFTTNLALAIQDAKLWSPDNPFLYDLTITLRKGGMVLDTVRSYFGMRSVGKQPDPKGFTRFLLNGRPALMAGALDQGFWPDGLYTAATDGALRQDVEIARQAGLNIIRKHVKVEPDRFYYWCDKLGLMVLQDMPTGKEGDPKTDLPASPEAAAQCELEKRALIEQRWNHPSVIAWCPFNEGWGQHDTLRYARWIKELDPSRLVDEASGFPWHGGGDIQDNHGGVSRPNPRQIGLVSENGGYGLATPGHDWPCEIWTYHSYDPRTGGTVDAMKLGLKGDRLPKLDEKSKAWFTAQVARLYTDLWAQKDRNGMTGQFFCQLYDTESECDGLVSYDRAVWKVDPEVIKAAATGRRRTPQAESKSASDSPSQSLSWTNPLPFQYTEGQTAVRREVRDPCIVRDGDTYYLVFTMWPFANREEKRLGLPDQGSSPGIALYSSPDLESWRFENWLVKSSELPDNCPYKHRFWAPEIHRMGGKFYLIFTADNWLKKEHNPAGTWGTAGYAFVGVADKIPGPYQHITYIRGAACDTSLFEDADGKTYAIIPRHHIDLQEIDLTGLRRGEVKLLGQPRRIVTAENTDIGIEARPDYLEGPWLEKIGDQYCLFYAEIYRDKKYPDWLGYWTGVAYADTMLGPWKKDPRGRLFLGGHLAVFRGPDNHRWFSYRGESDNNARGLLCADPFELDSAGRIQILPR